MKGKLIGYLGSCGTPECGSVHGYFCVRCRHYVSDCRCTQGYCSCPDDRGWAGAGERKRILERLAQEAAS